MAYIHTNVTKHSHHIYTLSHQRLFSVREKSLCEWHDYTKCSASEVSAFHPNHHVLSLFQNFQQSHLGEIKILNGVKFKVNLAGFLLHHTYRFHSHCLWLSLFLATAHLSGSSAENSECCYGLRQFIWAGTSKRVVHNCHPLAFKPDTLLIQSPIHYCPMVHKTWSYETVKLFLNTYTWTLSLHPFFFSLALSSTSTSSLL